MAFLKVPDKSWRNAENIGTSNEVLFQLAYSDTSHIAFTDGITSLNESRNDGPRGLGDFQRRLNRDRDQGWARRRDDRGRDHGRDWDLTPRSERGYRDAPSVRVPNVGWDSTPQNGRNEDGTGWGGARNRAWDAPTPRAVRGGSPEDSDGALGIDAREWEEEQVKLDRDWYTGAEEGGVAGDEENNPLAQYEDLSSLKDAEIANKQVVSPGFETSSILFLTLFCCIAEEDLG